MLPGRRYTPGDVWNLLVRFKWLILLPWVVVSVTTLVVVRALPNRYRSESLIQVVPPRVPQNVVRTVIVSIEDRLPAISQQILSRTRLERIIQDFGLYTEEKKTELMEDIVRQMRNDIRVNVVKGDAFQVTFESSDARVAMRVTERVASLFVEENLRDREGQAEGANQFLDSQLDEARRGLLEREKKLEEYRRQYSGQLPTQLQSNLQSMQNLQNQLTQVAELNNRDQDRRLLLERTVVELESEAAAAPALAPGADGQLSADAPAAARLELAKAQLARAELQWRPDHPNIRDARRQIRDLESQAAAEALAAPVSPTGDRPANPVEAARRSRLSDFRAQIDSIDRQMAARAEAEKKIQRAIADYDRRVDATPTRESEMIALTRDYTTLQQIYTELLSKSEDAKVSANLEWRQIGEQFKVIDTARLPEKPFSPNRPLFNMVGILGGLALGIGLVGWLEFRDSSFRTDADVVTVLALPVLATIPAILTPEDRRRRQKLRLRIVVAVVAGAGVAGALGLAWRLNLLQRLF